MTDTEPPYSLFRLAVLVAILAIGGTIIASAVYFTMHLPSQQPALKNNGNIMYTPVKAPSTIQQDGRQAGTVTACQGSNCTGADSAGLEGKNLKTIGIIGGMSWYSTQEYYKIINKVVQKRLGGLHSAKILMYSVDFDEIERLQTEGKWDVLTQKMIADAQLLENGGADYILIGTNTMHKTADDVQANVRIPVLHIADATGVKIQERGLKKVGLLGTKYTMEQDFYKGRLENNFGLVVIVPNDTERAFIHSVIFNELCKGEVKDTSRERFKQIIQRLADEEGVEGVILGCTEIPLLIKQSDVNVTLFDTTQIHAQAAAELALGGNISAYQGHPSPF